MMKKFTVYIVSVFTLTAVLVVLNKMILLAVSSLLPVNETELSFCNTIIDCISAVISIFYGLTVVSAMDRNDK